MRTVSIVIIVVLFLVIVGVIIFSYFRYEKPQEKNEVYLIPLSIFARDGDKLIRTNFSVFSNGFFLGSGLTNQYDATLYKVPFNTSITVMNTNLPTQTYYRQRVDFLTDKNETTRVDLVLTKVGNLTVTSQTNNFKMNTTVSSDGYFKNMVICIDWSIHVIYAEIQNMSKIDSIENHTKCYQGQTLNNENFNFIIQYNSFGVMNDIDFISVSFYDFDETYTLRKTYKNNNI